MSVACPDCKKRNAREIGRIPATNIFAGRELDYCLPGETLYRCSRCLLGFRYPRLPKERLDELYRQGASRHWNTPTVFRPDWQIAYAWMRENLRPQNRVLDVGCFDGRFLEAFVNTFKCYGIEIHPAARKRAEDKGIELIGSDFNSIPGKFDSIVAFDVIEHMEYPRDFIRQCHDVLVPGGTLILATGNMDAFSFRLLNSKYYYCTIAEHISFISPSWVGLIAQELDFQIEKQKTYSHVRHSIVTGVRQSITNLLYWGSPTLLRIMRQWGLGGKDVTKLPELADYPPTWNSAKDHFIVLLRKK